MKAIKKLIAGGLALSLMASANVFGQVAYGKTLGEVTQKAVYSSLYGDVVEELYQANPVYIDFGQKEIQFDARNESHLNMLQAYIQKNCDDQFSFEKYTMEVRLDPYEQESAIITARLKCGDFVSADVFYQVVVTEGYLNHIVKYGTADYDLSVEWTGENIADKVLMKEAAESFADFCKESDGYFFVGKQEVTRLVDFQTRRVYYSVTTQQDSKGGDLRLETTEFDADAKIIDNFKSNEERVNYDKEEKALVLKLKQKVAVIHKNME